MDDLIQEQLMSWLEQNSTLTEKEAASNDSEEAGDQKPAAKKKTAKSETDSES